MKTRVLIVDDEPLARTRLRDLLEPDPEVELVGECADGGEAVAAIRDCKPDVVFLDVQMPEVDGFGVVREVGPDNMPATVFVTAFDRYALQAFEVNALDYLLKPFDRERFAAALRRAKDTVHRDRTADAKENLIALLGQVKAEPKFLQRVAIKTGEGICFLRAEEIDWVEAAGNFVRFHAGGKTHLLRETMNSLEAKLDPEKFFRIHRSTIVHIEAVKELQPLFHGDYAVILRDGTQLTMSRGYRPKLQKFFGNSL
jgi:two-component system LytT family response regulator